MKAAAKMFEYFGDTAYENKCKSAAASLEAYLMNEYYGTVDSAGHHYIAVRNAGADPRKLKSLVVPEGLLYYSMGGLLQTDPDWSIADGSGKLGEALRYTAYWNTMSSAETLNTPTRVPEILDGQGLTWLSKTYVADIVNSRAFNWPAANSNNMYYGENTYWSFSMLVHSGRGFTEGWDNVKGCPKADCLVVYPRGVVSYGLIREPKAVPNGPGWDYDTYSSNCAGHYSEAETESADMLENVLLSAGLKGAELASAVGGDVFSFGEPPTAPACMEDERMNCQDAQGCWGIASCSGGKWETCTTNLVKCGDGICRPNCTDSLIPSGCIEGYTTLCITPAGTAGMMMCIDGAWGECGSELADCDGQDCLDAYYASRAKPEEEPSTTLPDAGANRPAEDDTKINATLIERYVDKTAEDLKDSDSGKALELASDAERTVDEAKDAAASGDKSLSNQLFESAYESARGARSADRNRTIIIWCLALLGIGVVSFGFFKFIESRKKNASENYQMPRKKAKIKEPPIKPVYYYSKR